MDKKYMWKTTVDCVDFTIKEPAPFDPKWYTPKHNGAGFRYELAMAIFSSNVVWFSGPYPCGENQDLTIFRKRGLRTLLKNANERCIADGIYKDPRVSEKHKGCKEWRRAKSRFRARHETLNSRLKSFKILEERFRSNEEKFKVSFKACLFFTQIDLKYHPLMNSFD